MNRALVDDTFIVLKGLLTINFHIADDMATGKDEVRMKYDTCPRFYLPVSVSCNVYNSASYCMINELSP